MDSSEKIEQFRSITNSSEDVARKYLEACAGDINMAIGMHLESQGLATTTPAEPTPPVTSPESYERIHGVRAPIPQTSGVLIEEEAPTRRILRSRKLPQTVFNPFQDYSSASAHNNKHGNDPTVKKLAEMFCPPHDLLFNGTFHEAKLAGQQKNRWLLVNLQDSKEFASQVLNRDVWSNYNVKELIQRYFVFIQIQRITDEGVFFRQLYHIESFPTVAILDPRTGEKMVSWGPLSADKFLHEASEFLCNNPFEDLSHTNGPNQSIINLSEESQLEAAIQASLEAASTQQSLQFSDDSDTDYFFTSPDRQDSGHTPSHTPKSSGQPTQVMEMSVKSRVVPSHKDTTNHSTRKRRSNYNDDRQGEEAKKKPRVDLDPMCAAIDNIELTQTLSKLSAANEDGSEDRSEGRTQDRSEGRIQDRTVGRKGRKGRVSKGKGKAGTGREEDQTCSSDCRTVEELLAVGEVCQEEVSRILFRLPDGSRLHKSFLCKEPIRDMFKFLEEQGIDLAEHEVVTHFPRKSLLSVDRSSTLRQNGLYPRETVFVHTLSD